MGWRDLRALREPDAFEAWLRRLTVRACYGVAKQGTAPQPGRAARDARPGLEQHAGRVDRARRARLARTACWVDSRSTSAPSSSCTTTSTSPSPRWPRILDIPYGTAASRLHRGLESMRTIDARRTRGRTQPVGRGFLHERRTFLRASPRRPDARPSAGAPSSPTPSTTTSDIEPARMRQRPRWLALIKEPPMRISSTLAVGSPTARLAAIWSSLTLLPDRARRRDSRAGASLLPRPTARRRRPGRLGHLTTITDAVAIADGRRHDPGETRHLPRERRHHRGHHAPG